MPEYGTPGSVAFDVYAREMTTIEPKAIGFIPTNLIVCIPAGYGLLLCSRSSTPGRKGLSVPHGFGIIDQDYCGPDDEMKVLMYNFTNEPVTVERGERIAQAMLIEVTKPELIESEPDPSRSRGGFGSTG
jgi:dUTP pyrophosphatase